MLRYFKNHWSIVKNAFEGKIFTMDTVWSHLLVSRVDINGTFRSKHPAQSWVSWLLKMFSILVQDWRKGGFEAHCKVLFFHHGSTQKAVMWRPRMVLTATQPRMCRSSIKLTLLILSSTLDSIPIKLNCSLWLKNILHWELSSTVLSISGICLPFI